MNVRTRQVCRGRVIERILIGVLILFPCGASAQSTHDCNDPFSSGIILNCGFEDATPFNSWIVTNTPGALMPWTILPAGPPPLDPRFFPIVPTEGSVAACHGFDGQSGLFRMAQDLNLLGIGVSTVEFDFRAAWEMTFGATLPRIFEVNIEPFGGGAPMASAVVFSAQPGTTVFDTGFGIAEIDLRSFGGGMIRLSLDAVIPESSTGPGTFQLDNVQIHPPVQLAGGELVGTTGQALNQLIGIEEDDAMSWLRHQIGQFDMVTDLDFRAD